MQSAFILLLIFGCIGTISTYQCYRCSGSDCDDPLNTDTANKVEATASEVCKKDKTTSKGGSTVSRSAEANAINCIGGVDGCQKYEQHGYTHTVCCCTSNLCNSVSTVRQQPLFILVTIGTLAMLAYRWF